MTGGLHTMRAGEGLGQSTSDMVRRDTELLWDRSTSLIGRSPQRNTNLQQRSPEITN